MKYGTVGNQQKSHLLLQSTSLEVPNIAYNEQRQYEARHCAN